MKGNKQSRRGHTYIGWCEFEYGTHVFDVVSAGMGRQLDILQVIICVEDVNLHSPAINAQTIGNACTESRREYA